MTSFQQQLYIYQQQHTNPINRMTHYIGIPAIVFSLLMLLNWISIDIAKVWVISFSWILLIAVLVYYFLLNIRIALLTAVIMTPITLFATWLASPTPHHPWQGILFLVLFIGGWALQFLGHYFEKKKPAFFDSFKQLLIGPLFILVELLKIMKIEKYFLD